MAWWRCFIDTTGFALDKAYLFFCSIFPFRSDSCPSASCWICIKIIIYIAYEEVRVRGNWE